MIIDRHHLALYAAVLVVGVAGAYGYHERSMDVAEAQADARAKQTVIDSAEKRMADRDAETKQTIAVLLAQKSTPATTPTQIVERIPQYFPQLQPTVVPANPVTKEPEKLVFDAPQAKALNDQLVECKVCSIERDKLKADLADQQLVTLQRTKEVQDWKTAAKGGSIWKRAGRAAKWIVIGGLAGYAIARH